MTNSDTGLVRVSMLLGLTCVGGCLGNGDGGGGAGSSSSSGTYLLACSDDADCVAQGTGAHCDKGVCVDATGEPIVVGPSGVTGGSGGASGTPGAGSGAGGTGTSGTGGGLAGTSGSGECSGAIPQICRVCADGSCGTPKCVGGSYEFVCPEDGAGGSGGTGGSADAGIAFVLPSCFGISDGQGTMCNGKDDQPIPECCGNDGTHLRCEFAGCTNGIPASCTGTWEPVVGSDACGGYQPCAEKNCGDQCSICDPNDKMCVETADIKVCTGTGGMCVSGAVDCTPPEKCDPFGANTCGMGMACCEVGRCGPLGTTEGICEAADPATGGCKVCECEKQPGGCPICNSPDTPILTPTGERAIAELREGDLVLSMDHGALVAVSIARTRQVLVHDHAVVRLLFDNGSHVEISGSHPTADGGRLDALLPGDMLGDARVLSAEMVPYTHDRTYDILPASDSGTYVAGGALIGSTLMLPGVR